jgi:hypothetical protein
MNGSAQQPRAQRFPLKVPIHYRKSGMLNWHDGRTVNISHTGVLFQTDENLQTGLKLEIRIALHLKTTLACQGTVVRIEPTVSTSEKTGLAARISHYRLISPEKLQETPI